MTLDTRSFIDAAWPRDAQNEPGVRRWRAAGRVTLAMLLGFSALQYHFLDVQVRIMAMPGVIVFARQRAPSPAIQASGAQKPCNSGTQRRSAAPDTPLPCG
jgi:hypothetical protein